MSACFADHGHSIDPEPETEAERLLDGLRACGQHCVWEIGPDGRFTYVSDTFSKAVGLTPRTLLGRTREEIAADFGSADDLSVYRELFVARQPIPGELYRLRRADGGMGYFRVSGQPRFAPDGGFLGYRGVTSDVTDITAAAKMAQAASAALRESERRFRAILDSSFGFYVLLGADGIVMEVNQAFLDFLSSSRDDVLGYCLWEIKAPGVDPGLGRRLMRAVRRAAGGDFVRDEATISDSNGKPRTIDYSLKPVRNERGGVASIVAEGRDITARRDSEARNRTLELELLQTQKMESLGTLAGGIAHEINTPVQYVGDNLSFLADSWRDVLGLLKAARGIAEGAHVWSAEALTARLAAWAAQARAVDLDFLGEEIPQAVTQSMQGVQRVGEIVRAIKAFSHPDAAEMQPHDLRQLIETTLMVSRNQWKYVAEVETDFADDLPPVMCHAGEISQVILNLVVNAAHAIEDKVKNSGERGVIRIATAHDHGRAVLKVADTGSGIRPEHRGKVFDLFFTTKPQGRGTGHGLSICHSIITKKHGGSINFDTVVGAGTTFTVVLPVEAVAAVPEA